MEQSKLVYGIVLAEETTRPCIVEVTAQRLWDEYGSDHYFGIDTEEHLGSSHGMAIQIFKNKLKPNRKLSHYFTVFYLYNSNSADKSMCRPIFVQTITGGKTDKSMCRPVNKCVQAITGGKTAHNWLGPILVVKFCKRQGFVFCCFKPVVIHLIILPQIHF